MHEASIRTWMQEPHFRPETLGSLHGLNLRFLNLAASGSAPPAVRRCALENRLASLAPAQRAAAARCPYALFDLAFEDAAYWRARLAEPPRVEEPSAAAAGAHDRDFAQLALFYAWHVAAGPRWQARLILGMSEDTAEALRAVSVQQLPPLIDGERRRLGARFGENAAFWEALARAASGGDPALLKRVQLYGLQVAAATGFDVAVRASRDLF